MMMWKVETPVWPDHLTQVQLCCLLWQRKGSTPHHKEKLVSNKQKQLSVEYCRNKPLQQLIQCSLVSFNSLYSFVINKTNQAESYIKCNIWVHVQICGIKYKVCLHQSFQQMFISQKKNWIRVLLFSFCVSIVIWLVNAASFLCAKWLVFIVEITFLKNKWPFAWSTTVENPISRVSSPSVPGRPDGAFGIRRAVVCRRSRAAKLLEAWFWITCVLVMNECVPKVEIKRHWFSTALQVDMKR